MLTPADNELLTRVSAGTPMGELMRRYWIPALLPAELPAADCPPIRLRLLSEDLVAWRDTTGRVGMMKESCPHRGASMFFGRNEETGLRCVYHGWKFDTTGACVDMPNEPVESNFKHKIRATAYPCIEQGGIVWLYMGAPELQPALPEHACNLLPAEHSKPWKRHQASNWMQALEGGIDPGHAAFLHSKRGGPDRTGPFLFNRLMAQGIEAHVHVLEEEYGVLIATRRNYIDGDDGDYWRTNVFLFPFYTMVGNFGNSPYVRWSAWIPMDDENTMRWQAETDPVVPILKNDGWVNGRQARGGTAAARIEDLQGEALEPPSHRIGSPFRTIPNKDNDYLQDRTAQKTWNYTGMTTANVEDQAVTESMGTIYTRHREHLGTTDLGIIATRKALLRAAKALRDHGTVPRGVAEPGVYTVTASNVVLPKGSGWAEGVREATRVKPGAYHKMVSL